MPTLTVWVAEESRTDFGLNTGPTLGAAMEFSEDQGRRTRRRGGMNAPSWELGGLWAQLAERLSGHTGFLPQRRGPRNQSPL